MALSIGIVGLPNVGKSTLFNALTDADALAANYPFATIEPNTGIVPVPDERLEKLSKLYGNAPIKPATVTFVDIAGLVAGASQGEGLGNQFLSHIRSCNAICQVVRAFDDPNVTHVDEAHNPQKDISVISTELVLADLQTVEKRLPKLRKEAKANPKLAAQVKILEKLAADLDDGKLASASIDPDEASELADLQLLTLKPIIYLFNVNDSALGDQAHQKKLAELVSPSLAIFVSAKLEDELKSLEPDDQAELLASYGTSTRGLDQLIQASYKTLGLQSFLTAGEKEVRAWTIPKGSTAPQAAGVIHKDFERGFIAAEIVSYNELTSSGSLSAARAAGKVRTEGKTYAMKPDDISEFRFNVSK